MSWQCLYTSSCGVGESGHGGVFGGGIIVYLETPISVSSVTGGGRFGTTVRTRAQGLDDEWNEGR